MINVLIEIVVFLECFTLIQLRRCVISTARLHEIIYRLPRPFYLSRMQSLPENYLVLVVATRLSCFIVHTIYLVGVMKGLNSRTRPVINNQHLHSSVNLYLKVPIWEYKNYTLCLTLNGKCCDPRQSLIYFE